MNKPHIIAYDASGSMPPPREFIIGDVHGGTDVAAALRAVMLQSLKGRTKAIYVTDGEPRRRNKEEQARVNRYVQQMSQRGRGKMRTRRIALKSRARCFS
jgi:hypothetical protein